MKIEYCNSDHPRDLKYQYSQVIGRKVKGTPKISVSRLHAELKKNAWDVFANMAFTYM